MDGVERISGRPNFSRTTLEETVLSTGKKDTKMEKKGIKV
jgi:hypothetical protein